MLCSTGTQEGGRGPPAAVMEPYRVAATVARPGTSGYGASSTVHIKHILYNFTSFSQAALIMVMTIIIKIIIVISKIYYTCINVMFTRLYLNNSPTSADC